MIVRTARRGAKAGSNFRGRRSYPKCRGTRPAQATLPALLFEPLFFGRLLGLPGQRINAFVTGGGEMPDAERTLQLLAWSIAVRKGTRPG